MPSTVEIDLLQEGIGQEIGRDVALGDAPHRLEEGLRRLNLLRPGERLQRYRDVSSWVRGGAETFVAQGLVTYYFEGQLQERQFVAKALVSFGTQPHEMLASWLRSRDVLASRLVRLPELYAATGGTLYEEHIAEPFRLDGPHSQAQLEELARVAVELDDARFQSLAFLHDLRVQGGLVYYVDFGSDLGPPEIATRQHARETLDRDLKGSDRDSCLAVYDELWQQRKCLLP